jgi:outer membrane protein TolC
VTLVLLAFLAQAQPLIVTEDEAVKLALKHSPELGVLRASEAVAAAQAGTARVLAQPEFRFSRNNLGLDPETLEARTTVGLRWSPPRPFDGRWKLAVAAARQQGARAQTAAEQTRLVVQVRLAYRRAAIAQEHVRVAGQALELRRGILETVRKQVAAGLKDASEADLLELEVAESEAARQRAGAQAKLEAARLASWIGSSEVMPAAGPEVFQRQAPPDVETWMARAALQRGEVSLADSECREAEAARGMARNQRYPWLSFVQATRRTTEVPGRGAWGFQFGVDIPLVRTAAAVEARVAAAELTRCRANQAALRLRVRREVEQAAANLRAAAEVLLQLEKLYSGPALSALERLRTALEKGRADRVQVLQAETRRVELRRRWLDKRVEYARLESEFESAAGMGAQ